MTSPGATAVSSTSVPMRNWARLTVTELPTFPPPAEGKGGGGEDDFEMGMIAQAVKNGIQASRKRAARRCIGSESNKEVAQSHGVGGKVGSESHFLMKLFGLTKKWTLTPLFLAKRPAARGYAGAGPARPLFSCSVIMSPR